MAALETYLSCSGICTNYGYYMFSNINNGDIGKIPTCLTTIFSYLKSKATYAAVLGWVISFLILLNIIFSCYECCKRRK